ncbi:MAG: TetR/AcrR family transcriptional regulator [Bacteroidota bacterium]
MESKNKILEGAESLFMKYGFKSITMDDIARELGISKKTLYQYFEDKNDLVNQTIQAHIDNDAVVCNRIIEEGYDPIEFMFEMSKSITKNQRKVNVAVLFDLRKYFKSAWDKMEKFRLEYILKNILSNISKGQELGLYRTDINEVLIAKLYVHNIEFVMTPELYQDISTDFHYIHLESLKYHLRGICTDKGLKKLNKITENQNNNTK